MSKKPNGKPPIVRLKERLQFTGWLQYLPLAVLSGLLATGRFLWEVVHFKLEARLPERIPAIAEFADALQMMRSRVSCRSFQSKDVNENDRAVSLESARVHSSEGRSPGSHGIRYEYVNAPLTVWPVVGAREFLVAIAPAAYSRINVIEVGRGLPYIVLEATSRGTATCWIGPGLFDS